MKGGPGSVQFAVAAGRRQADAMSLRARNSGHFTASGGGRADDFAAGGGTDDDTDTAATDDSTKNSRHHIRSLVAVASCVIYTYKRAVGELEPSRRTSWSRHILLYILRRVHSGSFFEMFRHNFAGNGPKDLK